jgi:hypothetical protein
MLLALVLDLYRPDCLVHTATPCDLIPVRTPHWWRKLVQLVLMGLVGYRVGEDHGCFSYKTQK